MDGCSDVGWGDFVVSETFIQFKNSAQYMDNYKMNLAAAA